MIDQSRKELNKQIDKLGEEDFDLEAWKASSIALLGRIFGSKDPKIEQIKGIKMDFGSWSLRDTGASRDPLGSCKKQGREILEMAIDELEAFGLPKIDESSLLKKALEANLTVSQYNAMMEFLEKEMTEADRSKELLKKLNSFGKEKLSSIVKIMLLGE